MPLCQELAQIIINDRAFYDLPRKFNIAYDGGGLIGTVEDTNDIGAKAVKVGDEVFFRIALGGATGHKAFARDLGVLVEPAELNKVVMRAGAGVHRERQSQRPQESAAQAPARELDARAVPRRDREAARISAPARAAEDAPAMRYAGQDLPHSHVGVFPQKQPGLNYVGVALPGGADHAEADACASRISRISTAPAKSGSRSGRTSSSRMCRMPTWRR